MIGTVCVLILNKFPVARAMKIMTISASDYHCEEEVMEIVQKCCKVCRVKSRTMSAGELNLIIEFSSDREKECTDALLKVDSVHSVSTLTHDGEVTY